MFAGVVAAKIKIQGIVNFLVIFTDKMQNEMRLHQNQSWYVTWSLMTTSSARISVTWASLIRVQGMGISLGITNSH